MLVRPFFATQRAEGRGYRRLDEDRVREIKKLLVDGARVIDVAKDFRVGVTTVYEIKRGERWGYCEWGDGE